VHFELFEERIQGTKAIQYWGGSENLGYGIFRIALNHLDVMKNRKYYHQRSLDIWNLHKCG
jgi:hypothetical protein